ncbi:MAG: asparagine synthase (glutamine-hydrolyzing) [Planctomycetota bacterium]
MCGIAGILRVAPAPTGLEPGEWPPAPESRIPERWLDALDSGIMHRGPDDQGRHRDRVAMEDGSTVDVAFVHRRLTVIDPDGGAQPMVAGGHAHRGRVALVFNGCIYNNGPLRHQLKSAGARFETGSSDTEVLLQAYRNWGRDMLEQIEGMYAFGVWDARKAQVILGRDPAGEKPLYTARLPDGSGYAFASTASALVNFLRSIDREIERRHTPRPLGSVEWVATGGGRNAPIDGVHVVPPGTRVTIQMVRGQAEAESKTHWAPPPKRERRSMVTAQQFDQSLEGIVAARMQSDVPLGVFLSGGVDSSLIAYYASKRMRTQQMRLLSFCLRMPDDQHDESGYAEAVAHQLGTEHQTFLYDGSPLEDLETLVRSSGLPLGDSSILPTYWLCKCARNSITVALTGDGADELFGGYQRHVAASLLDSYGPLLRIIPERLLPQRDPKSGGAKLARLIKAARNRGYADLRAVFPSHELRRLIGPQADEWLKRPEAGKNVGDPLMHDFLSYLPRDILRKVDTASMAVGLEVRAPFLDRGLIAAAFREPISALMPGRQRKGLLRRIARAHLNAELVDRPKMGFALPLARWFREDHGGLTSALGDLLKGQEPFPGLDVTIPPKHALRLISEHKKGRRDHSQRLFQLLSLSVWSRWLAGHPPITSVQAGPDGVGFDDPLADGPDGSPAAA